MGVEDIVRSTDPALQPEPAALPRIALIVATVDRDRSLQQLLSSLVAQAYPKLDVIIADQNDGDLLAPIVRMFEHRLRLVWMRTPRGLSRARNAALKRVHADIVGFPDDDCFYPLGFLHTLARTFVADSSIDGLCVPPVDEHTGERFRGFKGSRASLTSSNIWSLTSSIGLFLRSDVIKAVGGFDESLGLGAGTGWLASEDRDYPLRALENGFRVMYEPRLGVWHPSLKYDLTRAYSYGAACGRVLRQHGAGPYDVVRMVLVRPLGAALLALTKGKVNIARYYIRSMRGRIHGWTS